MRHQGFAAKSGTFGRFRYGSVPIVIHAPVLQLFPGIFKAHEPVRIQTFSPQFAVERFDERIVCGLARAAEVQRDPMDVLP